MGCPALAKHFAPVSLLNPLRGPPCSGCFDFRCIHEEIEFRRLISHCSKVRHVGRTRNLVSDPQSHASNCHAHHLWVVILLWGHQLHVRSRCQNRGWGTDAAVDSMGPTTQRRQPVISFSLKNFKQK